MEKEKVISIIIIISIIGIISNFSIITPVFAEENIEPFWNNTEDHYEIENLQELNWIRNDLDNDYILTDNINAENTIEWNNENGWKPIENNSNYFIGEFNGDNYIIKNLHINRENNNIGLFSQNNGILKNIGLDNITVIGENNIGGLVGQNNNIIKRTFINSENIKGYEYIGGLVGKNNESIISSYSNNNYIKGVLSVGGLVGINFEGKIKKSYSINKKIIGENYIGGFAGYNSNTDSTKGIINNCYSINENIIGNEWIGGLVGINYYNTVDSDIPIIKNSYAKGNIKGSIRGGLIGGNYGSVYDSFSLKNNDYNIINEEQGSQNGRVMKVSEENLKNIKLYTDNNFKTDNLENSWDITMVNSPHNRNNDNVWNIVDNGTLPFFSYQEEINEVLLENNHIILENSGGGNVSFDEVNWENKIKKQITIGENQEIYTENKKGWKFVKWTGDTEYIDNENSKNTIVEMNSENINLTAEFVKENYKISLENNGDGNISFDNVNWSNKIEKEITFEENQKIYADNNKGWKFVEWVGDTEHIDNENSKNTIINEMPAQDINLTAKFEKKKFTMNITVEGDGVENNYGKGSYDIPYDNNIELISNSNEGWKFMKWEGYIEENEDNNIQFKMPDNNVDINLIFKEKAIFKIDSIINITDNIVESDNFGIKLKIKNEGDLYDEKNISLYNEGWDNNKTDKKLVGINGDNSENVFLNWNTIIGDGRNKDNIMVKTEDDTIRNEILIRKMNYYLNINIEGKGKESNYGKGSHKFKRDSVVDLKAKPYTDWSFIKYYEDLNSIDKNENIIMDENKTVNLKFDTDNFKIEEYYLEDTVIQKGEDLKLNTKIINKGYDGEDTISYYINNKKISQEDLHLKEGENKTLMFDHTVEDTGKNKIIIELEDSIKYITFEVKEEKEDEEIIEEDPNTPNKIIIKENKKDDMITLLFLTLIIFISAFLIIKT
ncbi:MAG: InlB B-repeat-containing protein, partial [archaeon]